MNTVIAALARIVALGVALTAYYAAMPYLFPDDGGGANIGAGLIAFGALVLVSFGWACVDGAYRGFPPAFFIWAVVAAVFSIGWLIVLAVTEADASISVRELIVNDVGSLPFTAGLILAPAVVGAAIGQALRPSQPV